MRLGKYFMAAAVATMAVAPAMAAPVGQTAGVSAPVRAGSSVSNKSDLAGGGAFIAIIAVIAVIAGIVVVATNNDKPSSP